MKTRKITKYECEICGEYYNSKEDCLLCESRPVSQDKGVKIGDIVIVTDGEGKGEKAKVTSISICSQSWGHYWYWHTVAISADRLNGRGSRMLTFDKYKVAK